MSKSNMDSGPAFESEKKHRESSGTDGDQVALREHEHAVADERALGTSGVDEKALVRKLDLHLIPIIMGLYLFSFVDR